MHTKITDSKELELLFKNENGTGSINMDIPKDAFVDVSVQTSVVPNVKKRNLWCQEKERTEHSTIIITITTDSKKQQEFLQNLHNS